MNSLVSHLRRRYKDIKITLDRIKAELRYVVLCLVDEVQVGHVSVRMHLRLQRAGLGRHASRPAAHRT